MKVSCSSVPEVKPATIWIFGHLIALAYAIDWSIVAFSSAFLSGKAHKFLSLSKWFSRAVFNLNIRRLVSWSASFTNSGLVSYGQWHSTASNPAMWPARIALGSGRSAQRKPKFAKNWITCFLFVKRNCPRATFSMLHQTWCKGCLGTRKTNVGFK